MSNPKNENEEKIYKAYLNHSNIFKKSNPKLSLLIKAFIIEKIPSFSKENLKLIEKEKKDLKLSSNTPLNKIILFDEFNDILQLLFNNVDKEEKSEKVSYNTAAVFRLIADLLDILVIYEDDDVEEWVTKSNCLILL